MKVDLSYCHVLEDMFKHKKLVGLKGKSFNGLAAASTLNNLYILRALIKEYKPRYTIEIGMAYGASTLAILSTLEEEVEIEDDLKLHVAIDPFQTSFWDSTGIMSVQKAGLSNRLELREDFSYIALPSLLSTGQKFDLAYVDGSHLFEDVFIDFFYLNKLLNSSGLMIFDDSTDSHVRKVIGFIRKNMKDTYQQIQTSYFYSSFDFLKKKAASLLGMNQITVFRKIGMAEREWNAKFENF